MIKARFILFQTQSKQTVVDVCIAHTSLVNNNNNNDDSVSSTRHTKWREKGRKAENITFILPIYNEIWLFFAAYFFMCNLSFPFAFFFHCRNKIFITISIHFRLHCILYSCFAMRSKLFHNDFSIHILDFAAVGCSHLHHHHHRHRHCSALTQQW